MHIYVYTVALQLHKLPDGREGVCGCSYFYLPRVILHLQSINPFPGTQFRGRLYESNTRVYILRRPLNHLFFSLVLTMHASTIL